MSKRLLKVQFILIIILVFVLTGCSSLCNNVIQQTIESPDHKYIAYVFTRDGGATTKESYQLSILKKGKKFGNNAGNIFVSYGNFEVDWSNANKLIVKNNLKAQEFKKEIKFKNIKTEYLH